MNLSEYKNSYIEEIKSEYNDYICTNRYKNTISNLLSFLFDKGYLKADNWDYKLIAYVDGSYNKATEQAGCGVVLLDEEHNILDTISEVARESSMWNVSGEIDACLKAITWADNHDFHTIDIYYDYEGIEKWATRKWKCKKELTKWYRDAIDDAQEQLGITINFHKVKGHSNDKYNDMADALAKLSVGIN